MRTCDWPNCDEEASRSVDSWLEADRVLWLCEFHLETWWRMVSERQAEELRELFDTAPADDPDHDRFDE
jgi:hypothetical protein